MLRLSDVLKMPRTNVPIIEKQPQQYPRRVAWTFFMSPVRRSRYEGSMAPVEGLMAGVVGRDLSADQPEHGPPVQRGSYPVGIILPVVATPTPAPAPPLRVGCSRTQANHKSVDGNGTTAESGLLVDAGQAQVDNWKRGPVAAHDRLVGASVAGDGTGARCDCVP